MSANTEGIRPTEPKIWDNTSGDPLVAITSGHLWAVDRQRRNGLILLKPHYAEFAGPGAAVGGCFDQDCLAVLPLGKWRLLYPTESDDRLTAYSIRLQWLRLTSRFTTLADPHQRAQKILEQFEQYFDRPALDGLSDETLAALVGVLPPTMAQARDQRASL